MPSPCFSFDMFWSFREMSITCWSAQEWDDAVKEAQGQSSLCSLACVFLTDKQSGLGDHVEDPEGCGSCFCQALYGKVDPAAYLSAVEEDLTEQKLLFQKSDAEAMGQVLLIRQAENDASWTARKKEALLESGRQMQGEPLPRAMGVPLVCRVEKKRGQPVSKGKSFTFSTLKGKWDVGKWLGRTGQGLTRIALKKHPTRSNKI